MWDEISTKPLQGRAFREFRVELKNFPVDYEDKSTCEYVVKTIGVTKKMMHR